jgi:hypothetical protein
MSDEPSNLAAMIKAAHEEANAAGFQQAKAIDEENQARTAARYQRERDGVQAAGEAHRANRNAAADGEIAKLNADLAARDGASLAKGLVR